MFVDEASVVIQAGKGGDGMVHFHKEKYIVRGGPDGGDGGRGGQVFFCAKHNKHTLHEFRHQKKFFAENGAPGDKKNMTGKSGEGLAIEVPIGTIIRDDNTGETLADLVRDGQKILLAKGGSGGKGNAGFVNSVRQAPQFAEKGQPGEQKNLVLELKLIADVALVGFPNAGKSTFISVVSQAKPRIADYPFTTLIPNLGVAHIDESSLVFVDIPGLIEGASKGKGLGQNFLRHIERSRFLMILLDITSDPVSEFFTLRKELRHYSEKLSKTPFVVVLSKIDLVSDVEEKNILIKKFEQETKQKPYMISSATHEGIEGVLRLISSRLSTESESEEVEISDVEEVVQFRPGEEAEKKSRTVEITKDSFWWNLQNFRLEEIAEKTDWNNVEAIERIYDVLKKWGVPKKLENLGAVPGDKLKIKEWFLEYRGF